MTPKYFPENDIKFPVFHQIWQVTAFQFDFFPFSLLPQKFPPKMFFALLFFYFFLSFFSFFIYFFLYLFLSFFLSLLPQSFQKCFQEKCFWLIASYSWQIFFIDYTKKLSIDYWNVYLKFSLKQLSCIYLSEDKGWWHD